MSSVVAIIKSVIGQVFAVSIEGIQRQVFEGERLLQGEQLLTGSLGAVTLQTAEGKTIELGNNQQWPLREEESKQQDVDEDSSVEDLQQAITAGIDPSAEIDDTAAGPTAAGGSSGGGFSDGHSFVMLDATGQQLQAEVGYTTGGLGEPGVAQGIEQERNDNPLSPLELDPVAPSLVISGETQSLLIGQSTQIRFSFSESVQGFSAADIAASGGTISDLVQINATTWVATFTRGPSGAPGISVLAGSYTDSVGNPGTAGSLAINGAPQTSDSTASTGENVVFNGNVPAASDVDGTISSYTLLTPPSAGSLTFNPNGSYSFNPGSAFDDLAAGESRNVTFTYTATDNNGAVSAPATVTITVTGTNDDPVAQVASVSVAEDAALLSGSVVATDVDANASLTFALNNPAPAGLTFNSDGSYSFNAANSAYQSLGVGQSAVLTIPYTVTDDQGAISTANLVITVTGTNDAPVAQAASVSVAEDAALLSGSVVATDVDANASLTFALSGTAPAGLTFNSDGSYSFNAANSAYQSLGVGQSAVLTIPYTVTDDQGAISTANLVITVTGTNDLSVISSASVDVIESNASLNTGGTLSISDIDGPAPSFNPATNASGSGGYGLFNLGSNGVWSYSTTGPLNQLVAGQSYTDTLTVTAADGSTGTVTVTILGTNDAPVLGGVRTSFTYSESAASVITRTLLDSSVTLTDIDSSNFDGGRVFVRISNGVDAEDQLTVQNQGTGSGQISVVGSDVRYNFGSGAVSIGTISGGTGGTPLTISLNSNATPVAVDALVQRIAYGNSSQLPTTTPRTISITVNDGDGNANGGSSSVTQNITMNVTSVNDAPTFSNLGGARAFTEGGNAVVLDNNASLGDRELAVLGDFGGASLTLSRRGGTNSDDDFRGTGNLSLSAGEVRLSGALVGSYDQAALTNGTLQITFNSGTSNAQANSVLRQIAYSNGSDAPPASVVIDYALNDNNSGAQGTGGAKTATGSVTVNISAVNDAPVAGSQSNSTAEDAPFNGQIIASDVDGGSLTYSLQTGASNGSVTLNSSTGAFVYTPNAGYSGADSFTVQVSDGRGGLVNSVINMSVTPVDDAPVLSLTTPATPVEGNATEGNLISTASATDEDTPASGLSFSLTSNPGNVYAINAATGAVTLTAAGAALVNAGGDLPPVEVTVTDGNLADSGSMNVPATQDINDEPTAIPLSLTTVEDNAIDGKVVASDPDGDTLTYSITTGNGPQHGTVTLNPNGTFSYLPTKDYNGTDAFTVTIDDGNGGVTTSLVNITILPFNDAPETANQSKTTNEDQSVSGQVIATDVDGDSLSYIIQSGVANGSLLLNTATGEYTYTPNKDYNGTDSFTLRVYDPKGGYTDSVVTITVAPVNDDPKSSPLFVTTVEDNTATGKINARDVDGDTLTYSIATGNGPQHGTVTLNPDGTFSYLPAKDYNGTDAFTVTIDDGNGGVTTSFVNITIQPFNDAPETANQSKTTNEDQSVSGQIIASDVDGDSLSYAIQSGATHGSILLYTATGEYTYRPNKDYNGTDSFTIRVYDPKGGYSDSVVTVTVAPVNDAPTSGPLFMNTVEDIAANGTIITRDVDGGTLTYSIATGNGPQHGTVTLNPDGTFSYLPAKDYNGTDAFTVTIDDGNGGVTTSLVNITIQPFNDAPETANQSKTTNEDQSVSGQIIASDVDGDSLSYAIQSGATHGSILLYTATGEYTYRPNKDYNGTDTFTIRVYDPKGGYTDSVVTVTVNPVDDAPILSLTTPTTPVEGSAAEGNLISTASATDKDTPATGLSFSLTNNPGNVYAINAATGAVTLTAAGAALVNAGGDLPPVEVTVTDGTTPISGSVNVPATSDINDAPIINVTAQTLIENSAAAGSVAATYTASDEEASSFIVSFTPGSNDDGYYVLANGRVELTQAGADHVNAGNSLPPVSLVVTETGSPALTGTDSDTPNVTLTNDAPVANADTASTNEETPVTIDVLSNDSDVDGPTLSIKSASVDPAQGTVSIVAGQLVFTPASNFTGAATITYVSTDGSDDSAPATVTVTVNPVNDAPVANTDTASTNEDTPVTIDVLSNDSDVDGPALSIKSASVDPAQGTVSIVAGQLVFTPASNFTGTATITYVSTDGSDDSAPATVTVTVSPINDAPVANADAASTGENTVFNGTVPAASDIDGSVNPNGYALVNGPAAGNLTFNANGSYSFNPGSAFDDLAAGATREVTFTYTATDNNGAVSAPATVTITVTGTNDAPVAQAASVSVAEDAALLSGSVVATDVDANASLTFALNNPAPAGLTFNSDGSYSFNAANSAYQSLGVGQSAVLTIPYTVTDDQGAISTANLVITVTGTNDAPVAQASTASTGENTAFNGNVPAASDIDGTVNPNGYALVNGPAAGSLTFNANGSYSFNPGSAFDDLAVGESRNVTFTYTTTDNNGAVSAPATVTITVTGTNDAPTVSTTLSDVQGTEDTTITLSWADFGISDVDSAASSLGVTFAQQPANGSLQYQNAGGNWVAVTAGQTVSKADIDAGKLRFEPADDASGNNYASLQFRPTDGQASGALSTLTLDIAAVADAPLLTVPQGSGPLLPQGDVVIATGNITSASSGGNALTRLADGSLVVVFQTTDGDGLGSFARRVDANGNVLDAQDIRLNQTTASHQHYPSITALEGGGFVATWMSYNQDGSENGIYARRFDVNGQPLDAQDIRLNQTTAEDQRLPSITALDGDGFVATWVSFNQNGSVYHIYARRFDANGNALDAQDIRLNQTTANNQLVPSITALDGGGFVATWMSISQDGSGWGIYARRFDANGQPLDAQDIRLNQTIAGNQMAPNITALDGGGFVATWMSPDGSGSGIYARRFDANGQPLDAQDIRLNQTTAEDQTYPSITALDGGGFVATWMSYNQDGSAVGIYARRFDANGNSLDAQDLLINQNTLGDQADPHIIALPGGGFAVAYQDGGQIKLRQFQAQDQTPSGNEDSAIALPLTVSLADNDGSEYISVITLSGLPAGSQLNKGTDNGNGSWSLAPADLAGLTLTPPANYHGTLNLTLSATARETSNGDTASSTLNFQVIVRPLNDAPAIADASITVAENVTAGTVLTNVSDSFTNSDLDRDGQTITYSITGGNAAGLFAISSTGEITLASGQALDFETASQHVLTVTASDGSLSDTAAITVNVSNINDNPVLISDSDAAANTVAENAAIGTAVGVTALGTDADAGTSVTYALTNDAGGLFSIDPTTGVIRVAGALDAETAASHTVTVRATSSDGSVQTADFTIAVSNINDNPVLISDNDAAANTVAENAAIGTAVGVTALGTDADAGTSVTYALTNDAGGLFSIDPTTGVIRVAGALDAETAASHTVTVRATSSDGSVQTADFTIAVSNVNDNAPAIADASVNVAESITAGTVLTNVSDSFTNSDLDRDGQAITYSITGGNAAGLFSINVTNGEITLASGKALDFETASQHVLTVTASDGTLSDTAAITVNVSNVNDAPVNTLPARYTTNEDTALKLSGLSVSDVDAGSANLTVTLSVASGTLTASNAADVIISGSGTGELILTGSQTAINNYLANTGTQPTYTPVANANGSVALTMTTSDNGGNGSGGTKTDVDKVNIVITPVNDATAPTVTSTLKGQWTFNESSGSSTTSNQSTGASGTLNDTNGPNYNLPALNSSGARNAAAGNYIEFRDEGDRVDVAASATQALMGSSSMAFWINTTQTGTNTGSSSSWDQPTVLGSEQNGGGNDIQWGAINNSGKIGFGLGNVGGVYSTTSINNGQWHHVVITRDATSKLVQVYVNGVLEASGSPNDPQFDGTLNRLTSIGVNNNFGGSSETDNRFFQGKLDDLRIYNRVLTADQIQAVRAVENGFQNTALANDGNAILLALSGTYSAMTVSGLLAGMTISSGANSVTVTGPDQTVNLTGWDLSNLQLSNAGTGSTTLLFTAQSTHAATGDIATTYHAVSLANGTSQLADLTAGADTRNGSTAADLIRGGTGNDVLNGGDGNDRLEGGADSDTLNGDAGNDLLIGEAGNDILFGGADNDTLLGGDGTDTLRGGNGNDLLVGGSEADTFLWRNGDTGNDIIKDFKSAEGDRIDLRDLLQGENDANILNYLRVDTVTSTLQVSTTGQFGAGGSADVTIKLENGSGGNADLSSLGSTSADIVNSLIAGADPIVKIDHS